MGFQDSGYFRRKFPRRAFRQNVGMLLGGVYKLIQSGEIGEGGMSLIMVKAMKEGQELVVSFRIPGGDFVTLRAQAKASRPGPNGSFLCGISFKNIQFSHKRQIRTFVSERSEKENIAV